MDDKIKDTEKMSENEEVTAENLDGVAGGKGQVRRPIRRPWWWRPNLEPMPPARRPYIPPLEPILTPEELKKIKEKMEEERKKRESEEKMNQVSALGAGESSSTQ